MSKSNPPKVPIQRKTRPGVYRADQLAGLIIRFGGMGVLVAVLGISVYLAVVVLPLFSRGKADLIATGQLAVSQNQLAGGVISLQIDEQRTSMLLVNRQGIAFHISLHDGSVLEKINLIPQNTTLTSYAYNTSNGSLALGLSDGSAIVGTLDFKELVLPSPPELQNLPPGQTQSVPASTLQIDSNQPQQIVLAQRIDPDRIRIIQPNIQLSQPLPIKLHSDDASNTDPQPITLIDYIKIGPKQFLVASSHTGTASYSTIRTIRPLGGGPPRTKLRSTLFTLDSKSPDHLKLIADGTQILTIMNDGSCDRYNAAIPRTQPIKIIQSMQLLPADRSLTTLTMLLGSRTLLVGDNAGTIYAWFIARDPQAGTTDALNLVMGHKLQSTKNAISAIASSWRDRSIAIGSTSQSVVVRNVTSHKHVASIQSDVNDPILAIAMAPKNDGIVWIDNQARYSNASFEPGYPEITTKTLFGKVHFEGEPQGGYVYQSSAADDTAEIKLSLVPLIFGTIKATVFAMAFAIPLGVLAAIYSSEFLSPSVRRITKPVIEVMASVPSVVLGFFAAMIVAPFARDALPAILAALALIPLCAVLASHIYCKLLPTRITRSQRSKFQILSIALTLLIALVLSVPVGSAVQGWLFAPSQADLLLLAGSYEPVSEQDRPAWIGTRDALSLNDQRRLRAAGLAFRDGQVVRPVKPDSDEQMQTLMLSLKSRHLDQPDIRSWLDGNISNPWPGWFLALIAPAFAIVILAQYRLLPRSLIQKSQGFTGLIITFILSLTLAALGAYLLTSLSFDTRDSIFGTFSQRNSLVVGLIMGITIIPIIFTISEDSMLSVPNSLRSASLGAGATPWQTALRVVLPVAASGIFSACMIGLGRAVGETMIVLMATGNTPIMQWNAFSGMRTLAANIAVELPEAPVGTTHYRVLFLCGVVLFIMTFVINSTAEIVRQHFRRKNALL